MAVKRKRKMCSKNNYSYLREVGLKESSQYKRDITIRGGKGIIHGKNVFGIIKIIMTIIY
jgi:hypothetical protein